MVALMAWQKALGLPLPLFLRDILRWTVRNDVCVINVAVFITCNGVGWRRRAGRCGRRRSLAYKERRKKENHGGMGVRYTLLCVEAYVGVSAFMKKGAGTLAETGEEVTRGLNMYR